MTARWTCKRWCYVSRVSEMLKEMQCPTLEAQRDQSSLLFFHNIHCRTMSIDKNKYLTPYQRKRSTRSSRNSQYCRPQTYSDVLEYSFSQGLFHKNKKISKRPSTRSHTGGYYINLITMEKEGPLINGSAHGSLGAVKK